MAAELCITLDTRWPQGSTFLLRFRSLASRCITLQIPMEGLRSRRPQVRILPRALFRVGVRRSETTTIFETWGCWWCCMSGVAPANRPLFPGNSIRRCPNLAAVPVGWVAESLPRLVQDVHRRQPRSFEVSRDYVAPNGRGVAIAGIPAWTLVRVARGGGHSSGLMWTRFFGRPSWGRE